MDTWLRAVHLALVVSTDFDQIIIYSSVKINLKFSASLLFHYWPHRRQSSSNTRAQNQQMESVYLLVGYRVATILYRSTRPAVSANVIRDSGKPLSSLSSAVSHSIFVEFLYNYSIFNS
jgi:hypothetical protein